MITWKYRITNRCLMVFFLDITTKKWTSIVWYSHSHHIFIARLNTNSRTDPAPANLLTNPIFMWIKVHVYYECLFGCLLVSSLIFETSPFPRSESQYTTCKEKRWQTGLPWRFILMKEVLYECLLWKSPVLICISLYSYQNAFFG